ncbi:MAG: DsrE family protein [Nitrospinae bacterium]|nr:DsrE family protein [Nitrospinota bacterium]
MEEKKDILAILLTTSPEHENTHTVIKLAESAISMGKEVKIFMMCDGVYNVYNSGLVSLKDKGVEISVCEHNSAERGVDAEKSPVNAASLYILGTIIEDCTRLVAFNS